MTSREYLCIVRLSSNTTQKNYVIGCVISGKEYDTLKRYEQKHFIMREQRNIVSLNDFIEQTTDPITKH